MLPLAVRRRRREQASPPERWLGRWLAPWWGEELPFESDLTGAYPVDVHEEDDRIMVDAEMPGFKQDEIEVNLDNGILSITAERKPTETKGKSHLRERRYTRIERSFSLPASVDESSVDAKLDDGVLHLELPKTEKSKARRIEVK